MLPLCPTVWVSPQAQLDSGACSQTKHLICRLRDEHTLRARSESELEAVTQQAAAYKDKLQEATAGQAEATRLAADLDVERNFHKEAKSHVATLESRSVLPCHHFFHGYPPLQQK